MQHAAWRVQPTDEAETYRFHNVMRWAAGQVRIQLLGSDEPIVIPGPVGDDTDFEQPLKSGKCEISWHRMVGQPDKRVGVEFEVPFDGELRLADLDD
jgi:hypothetical protein